MEEERWWNSRWANALFEGAIELIGRILGTICEWIIEALGHAAP